MDQPKTRFISRKKEKWLLGIRLHTKKTETTIKREGVKREKKLIRANEKKTEMFKKESRKRRYVKRKTEGKERSVCRRETSLVMSFCPHGARRTMAISGWQKVK